MKEIKITLPEGADKLDFSVNINKDGEPEVTYKAPAVNVEEKKPEETFKDGDILYGCPFFINSIIIFKGVNDTGGVIAYAAILYGFGNERVCVTKEPETGYGPMNMYTRHATEEEKQRLFDALAKEGYRWNAEKKEVKKLPRWRALYGENYYVIGSGLDVDCSIEVCHVVDDNRNKVGNYFRTREAAERVAEQIREIFKNSKAE